MRCGGNNNFKKIWKQMLPSIYEKYNINKIHKINLNLEVSAVAGILGTVRTIYLNFVNPQFKANYYSDYV